MFFPQAALTKRWTNICLAMAIGFGIWLQSRGLTKRSMDGMEGYSWAISCDVGFCDSLVWMFDHSDAPGYYMILRILSRLVGDSVVSMRIFSVALSSVAVIIVYLLARDLMLLKDISDPSASVVGIVGAFVAASNPTFVTVGSQASPFILGCVFALAATWIFIRNVYRQGAARWGWLVYACVAIGGIYCDPRIFGLWCCHVLCAGIIRRRGTFPQIGGRSFIALGSVGLLSLPAVVLAAHQFTPPAFDVWMGIWKEIPRAWTYSLVSLEDLAFDRSLSIVIAVTITAVVIAGMLFSRYRGERLVGTSILTFVVMLFIFGMREQRGLTLGDFLVPGLLTLLAGVLILHRLMKGPEFVFVGIGLVSLQFFAFYASTVHTLVAEGEGLEKATQDIRLERRPGEPVIVLKAGIYFAVQYYFRDISEPNVVWLWSTQGKVTRSSSKRVLPHLRLCEEEQCKAWHDGRVWLIDTSVPGRLPRPELPYPWRTVVAERLYADANMRYGKIGVAACAISPGPD